MKAYLKVILVFALFFFSINASALLNQTEVQHRVKFQSPYIKRSYKRNPLLKGAINHAYKWQGWIIRVAYINKKAALIQYNREPVNYAEPMLTEKQIDKLLKDERNSGSWKRNYDSNKKNFFEINLVKKYDKKWNNTNGCIAKLTRNRTGLLFITPEGQQFLEKVKNNTTPIKQSRFGKSYKRK